MNLRKKFNFRVVNLEDSSKEGKFIIEGYAASNDIDFQNEIIADEALDSSAKDLIGQPVFFQHDTEKKIGVCLDAKFGGGKLWIKDEISNPTVKRLIKKGKLYNLSISGHVTKVELVYLPELDQNLRVIKGLHLVEHSVVFQGAQPEAKTIRWYLTKTLNMSDEKEKKLENLQEVEEDEEEDIEEAVKEDVEKEEGEKEGKFNCECLECGYTMKTDEHCSDIKCPECGGEMRRKERPGPGKSEEKSEEEGEETKDDKETEKAKVTAMEEKREELGMSVAEFYAVPREPPSESKLPIFDAAHVRNALARFSQTDFASKEEKEKAWKKLKSAAKKFDIEAGEEKKSKDEAVKKLVKDLEAVKKFLSSDDVLSSGIAKSKYSQCVGKQIRAGKGFDEATDYCDVEVKKELSEENVHELSDEEGERVYQVYRPGNIELVETSDGVKKFKKEILRTGRWHHSAAPKGILKITKKALKNIYENFKKGIIEHVFVPLGHTNDPLKNTGELVDVELSESGNKLSGVLEIKDDKVAKMLEKGLIRGISASIDQNYMNKKTGKKIGPALLHTALVSEPFIKRLGGFVPLSEEFEDRETVAVFEDELSMEIEELKEKVNKMEKKIKLEDKTSEEEETKSDSEPEAGEEKEEEEADSKADLADARADSAETEKKWDELLKSGKVVPAQKEAFLSFYSSVNQIMLGEEESEKVDFQKAFNDFMEKQPKVIDFEEKGTQDSPSDKKPEEESKEDEEQEEEIPVEAEDFYVKKMGFSKEDAIEAWKDAKRKEKEKKEEEESALF